MIESAHFLSGNEGPSSFREDDFARPAWLFSADRGIRGAQHVPGAGRVPKGLSALRMLRLVLGAAFQ